MGRLTQMVSNVLWWTSLSGRNGVEKSDIESNMRHVSKRGISPAHLKKLIKNGFIEEKETRCYLTPKGWELKYDAPYIEIADALEMDQVSFKLVPQWFPGATEDIPLSLFDKDYKEIGVTVCTEEDAKKVSGIMISIHQLGVGQGRW